MDLFEVIEKRHSYRGIFKDLEIPESDLIKIVDTALKAPSAKNMQTTEFIIVNDKILVEKINQLHIANKAMQTAKAFILCVIDKSPKPIIGNESFQIEDCSAAVENMLLAITALGYATVWIDGWLRFENREEIFSEMINLPKSKKVQILLPIGVPESEGKQPIKKSFSERVKYNSYQ